LSERDKNTLLRIRQRAELLVAIGTCAVWGGVAAMDGDVERAELLEQVYGPVGRTYDSTRARALREVVKVDLSIPGCPIEKEQFLAAVASLLNGDAPLLPEQAVCAECKTQENNCLLVRKGAACCGPLTVGGCGARCPAMRIPCVGCRGPAGDANVASALAIFEEKGVSREEIASKLRTFAPTGAWP
jgi:coenzyme F420-reducing hydrogenase gamma subunit